MRNKDLIKEVISQTLGAINEQEAVIQKYDGRIPQIEIDLILENIRRMYENFHLLDKLNGEEEGSRDEEVGSLQLAVGSNEDEPSDDTSDNPDEIEPQRSDIFVETTDPSDNEEPQRGDNIVGDTTIDDDDDEVFIPKTSISFGLPTKLKPETDVSENSSEITETVEIVETDQPATLSETVDTIEAIEPKTSTETVDTIEAVEPATTSETVDTNNTSDNGLLDLFADHQPTIADQYKTTETTIHDSIVSGDDNSLASRMQKIPINDLKSHIGINDRFRFINELFLASMKDYDEAIDQLNNFNNKYEALAYFNKITERYKMDKEMDSFIRLKDFILRKYL